MNDLDVLASKKFFPHLQMDAVAMIAMQRTSFPTTGPNKILPPPPQREIFPPQKNPIPLELAISVFGIASPQFLFSSEKGPSANG